MKNILKSLNYEKCKKHNDRLAKLKETLEDLEYDKRILTNHGRNDSPTWLLPKCSSTKSVPQNFAELIKSLGRIGSLASPIGAATTVISVGIERTINEKNIKNVEEEIEYCENQTPWYCK